MRGIGSVATVWILALVFSAFPCFGGIRSPGKYSGVVVFDRWDGCTLYSGIYVMYISEKTKDGLRPFEGQLISS